VHEEWTVSSVMNGCVIITLHNKDVHEERAGDSEANAADAARVKVTPEVRMAAKAMLEANNTTPSRVWTAFKLLAADRDSHTERPTLSPDQVPPIKWLQNLKKTEVKLHKRVQPSKLLTDTDVKVRSATDQEAVDRMMAVRSAHSPPLSLHVNSLPSPNHHPSISLFLCCILSQPPNHHPFISLFLPLSLVSEWVYLYCAADGVKHAVDHSFQLRNKY
jgi:hypothetical protein